MRQVVLKYCPPLCCFFTAVDMEAFSLVFLRQTDTAVPPVMGQVWEQSILVVGVV